MASGEQIAFEPALTQMLAQHLHNPAVDAEIDVDLLNISHPCLAGDVVNGLQPVRCGLVGAKDPKIPLLEIELHHITEKCSQNPRGFSLGAARCWH